MAKRRGKYGAAAARHITRHEVDDLLDSGLTRKQAAKALKLTFGQVKRLLEKPEYVENLDKCEEHWTALMAAHFEKRRAAA